uniref:P-type H+-ATPase n=1 Tax=Tanacetum cinerariifolium TaxID=118510 RepID=A0A6L2KRJ7_TANCI|nr:P-type H+-ATPase [Tanacetum cinerariifolium]
MPYTISRAIACMIMISYHLVMEVPQDYNASSAVPCLFIHSTYVIPCLYIRSLSVMFSRISFHVLYGRFALVKRQSVIDKARSGTREIHLFSFNPIDKRTALTYIDDHGNWHRTSKGKVPKFLVALRYLKVLVYSFLH